MKKLTWYAVIVELKNVFYDLHTAYGESPSGKLLKAELFQNDTVFAVPASFGGALKYLADQKAMQHGGRVITVKSDYMFNNSDIEAAYNAGKETGQ